MTVLDAERAVAVAAERGVAVVDGVDADPDGFEELARSAGGDLMFTPGERPLPGTGFVFEVTNRGRTTAPVSVWHTDTSYVAAPPAFTMLLAVDVPDVGGETLVIDQRAAHDELDDDARHELASIELLHVASRVSDPDEVGAGSWHPLVRRHPTTGRPALYLSAPERHPAWRYRGERTRRSATELVRSVYDRCTRQTPYRHRWRPGQVLILDNRVALHRADHSRVIGPRTLWRAMTVGEVPIPVEGELRTERP